MTQVGERAGAYPEVLPSNVSARWIDTPGGPLAALEASPDGPATATAVLVPGFSGSKEDFIPLLKPLTAAGFRVLAYDQRGQYQSPGPDRATAYRTQVFADDLHAVIGEAGPAVHLMGHSFGGLVARNVAITHPELLRSLTLLSSGPCGRTISMRRILRPGAWVLKNFGTRPLAEATLRDRQGAPAAELAWLRHRIASTSRANISGIMRAIHAEPDRVADLAATSLPLLVAYGSKDHVWSPAVQAEMAGRLNASRAVIARANHRPNEQQPAATAAELVTFWQSH